MVMTSYRSRNTPIKEELKNKDLEQLVIINNRVTYKLNQITDHTVMT
jgi:hypothetical protein